MRMRLTLHFARYFIIACLVILGINYLFVVSYVYRDDALYDYSPDSLFLAIEEELTYTDSSEGIKVEITEHLKQQLISQQLALQIIDEKMSEIAIFNRMVPVNKAISPPIQDQYTPQSLALAYADDQVTLHLLSKTAQSPYSLLVFDFSGTVKRHAYTYRLDQLQAAYNPFWLIGINVFLLGIISYLYTWGMSRPVAAMLKQIGDLSEGQYLPVPRVRGFYSDVSQRLNDLAAKLSHAQEQRQVIDQQRSVMAKQQQALEQEREKAVAIREAWIANLSHDLKTPLTAIVGFAELLEEGQNTKVDPLQKHYLKAILNKCNYIKDLIGDLNLSARLQGDQVLLVRQNTEMVRFVRELLIDHVNQREKDRHANGDLVNFSTDLQGSVIAIDGPLMRRALVNLIQNATIHNGPDVSLAIGLSKDSSGDHLIMTIEDDGRGVPAENLPHLFTRYYRGTNTDEQPEGTGLGMAIAADIIRAHGGEIAAENSPKGGLRLVIQLPKAF